MAVYAGRKGVVYLSTTGTGAASNVIKLNEWSLDQTTDMLDASAFGDSNKTYVPSLKDCTGSISGMFDDTEAKPFTAADSSDGCNLYLYPSSDATTKYWYGPAWLSGVTVNTQVSGVVTINANFAARGSWGRN